MLNSELTIITDMHSYAIHKELTKATRNIMKANDTTNALCRSRLGRFQHYRHSTTTTTLRDG